MAAYNDSFSGLTAKSHMVNHTRNTDPTTAPVTIGLRHSRIGSTCALNAPQLVHSPEPAAGFSAVAGAAAGVFFAGTGGAEVGVAVGTAAVVVFTEDAGVTGAALATGGYDGVSPDPAADDRGASTGRAGVRGCSGTGMASSLIGSST